MSSVGGKSRPSEPDRTILNFFIGAIPFAKVAARKVAMIGAGRLRSIATRCKLTLD
jgi:hypothetical protein